MVCKNAQLLSLNVRIVSQCTSSCLTLNNLMQKGKATLHENCLSSPHHSGELLLFWVIRALFSAIVSTRVTVVAPPFASARKASLIYLVKSNFAALHRSSRKTVLFVGSVTTLVKIYCALWNLFEFGPFYSNYGSSQGLLCDSPASLKNTLRRLAQSYAGCMEIFRKRLTGCDVGHFSVSLPL